MITKISLPSAVPAYKWSAFAAIAVGLFASVAYNNGGVAYQSLGKRKLAERDFQKVKERGYNL